MDIKIVSWFLFRLITIDFVCMQRPSTKIVFYRHEWIKTGSLIFLIYLFKSTATKKNRKNLTFQSEKFTCAYGILINYLIKEP